MGQIYNGIWKQDAKISHWFLNWKNKMAAFAIWMPNKKKHLEMHMFRF